MRCDEERKSEKGEETRTASARGKGEVGNASCERREEAYQEPGHYHPCERAHHEKDPCACKRKLPSFLLRGYVCIRTRVRYSPFNNGRRRYSCLLRRVIPERPCYMRIVPNRKTV